MSSPEADMRYDSDSMEWVRTEGYDDRDTIGRRRGEVAARRREERRRVRGNNIWSSEMRYDSQQNGRTRGTTGECRGGLP